MLDTMTRKRNKIIGDALAEYEVNRSEASRWGTAEQYANTVLRENGLPPLGKAELVASTSSTRRAAIQKACAEVEAHESKIACSRRAYIDETLRQVGEPAIRDEEIRDLEIRV